jgi:PIN domain nuclease of toxin-antitoxin system
MKIILDTHTVLWFIEGDNQLSKRARNIIEDTQNDVFICPISLFEISIKLKLGKLFLKKSLSGLFEDIYAADIKVLSFSDLHFVEYQTLPTYGDHKDPFDRLIISSAISENAALISADPKFGYYKDLVELIW